ncbi:MAG: GDYXXLXY domain-containing protein, partial [Bacteroidota bacterium]
MKPSKNQKILFFVIIAALICLPLYFILRSESMLSEKENIYRFRPFRLCEPAEIMRGDYLTIDFPRFIEFKHSGKKGRGEEVYVVVERDSAGYAYFDYATDEKPESNNYFTTKVTGGGWENNVMIKIPFERYFLSEDNSKLAEKLYEIEVRDPETNMYIEV